MNLYLTKSGQLQRKDNTLTFHLFEQDEDAWYCDDETPLAEDNAKTATKRNLPIEAIDAVYLMNEIRLNTKLLVFLAQKNIPVHLFNYYGHHVGSCMPHPTQLSGDLVIAQSNAYQDIERRLHICRAITEAKLHNQLSILQYYERRRSGIADSIEAIKALKDQLSTAQSPDVIMGIEGQAGRTYYAAWGAWVDWAKDGFKREYHPPTNPLNALISFLNSLLYTACVSELFRTALYPGISYIHAPQSRRFSLALDLVEPFKPVMVDRMLFRLVCKNMITDQHFRENSNGVLLNDDGRKLVLQTWDEQLRTTVEHKALKRSVSYRQLLRLDCYKLIKHLLENTPYAPYRISY